MSRIATAITVLSMLVAPAAFGKDLRSPDAVYPLTSPAHVIGQDERSPDAVAGYVFARSPQVHITSQDLRSPDAVHGFVAPAPAQQASAPNSSPSAWTVVGIALGALFSCVALVVLVRRRLDIGGRPAHV